MPDARDLAHPDVGRVRRDVAHAFGEGAQGGSCSVAATATNARAASAGLPSSAICAIPATALRRRVASCSSRTSETLGS